MVAQSEPASITRSLAMTQDPQAQAQVERIQAENRKLVALELAAAIRRRMKADDSFMPTLEAGIAQLADELARPAPPPVWTGLPSGKERRPDLPNPLDDGWTETEVRKLPSGKWVRLRKADPADLVHLGINQQRIIWAVMGVTGRQDEMSRAAAQKLEQHPEVLTKELPEVHNRVAEFCMVWPRVTRDPKEHNPREGKVYVGTGKPGEPGMRGADKQWLYEYWLAGAEDGQKALSFPGTP